MATNRHSLEHHNHYRCWDSTATRNRHRDLSDETLSSDLNVDTQTLAVVVLEGFLVHRV